MLLDGDRVFGLVAADAVPDGVLIEALDDDLLLAPGFVDLQVNGGGGVMFNDSPDGATLRVMAEAHAAMGTTTILPTLISSDRATRSAALAAAALARGAGVHLEGPFLAPARRGIHPAAAIAVPESTEIAELCAWARAGHAGVLMVTLAPEVVAANDITALVAAGCIVYAGHSEASFAQAEAGFDAGIAGTTHLFNAMSQLGSRLPGMVGAALLRGFAGIIVDLHHVHPASVLLAYRCMGPGRLHLVSDCMATAGSDCDRFRVGGQEIRLVEGRLADACGTLAGAHLSMAEAVRRAVGIGIPLEDALTMATRTPAGVIGRADIGRIGPGARADIVALDATLAVRAVWRGGERLAQIRSLA